MGKHLFVNLLVLVASTFLIELTGASSCVELSSAVIGNTSLGTNFTDYDYLVKNEDSTFTYKLAAVQLCVNSANQFVGMRSVVAKILTG